MAKSSNPTEYRLISDRHSDSLGEEVTRYLEKGWELYGFPFMSQSTYKDADDSDQTDYTFCQALIKRS